MQLATVVSMTTSELLVHLREEAKNLSEPERRALVRSLEETFEDQGDEDEAFDLHPTWGPELERRVAAIKDGTARSIPAADVIAELRARNRR